MGPVLPEVEAAKQKLRRLERQRNLAPAFLRLAVNDALTYDGSTRTGGCNASIATPRELGHRANAGLESVVELLRQHVQPECGSLSMADIIQLAGVVALEAVGGPRVAFAAGRKDSKVSPPEGRLPDPRVPDSFRQCMMKRAGLTVQDMVAMAGLHPFGRSFPDAAAAEVAWAAAPEAEGEGLLDHRYYEDLRMGKALGDPCLLKDADALQLVSKFAADRAAFLTALATAYAKLTALGTAAGGGAGAAGAAARPANSWAAWLGVGSGGAEAASSGLDAAVYGAAMAAAVAAGSFAAGWYLSNRMQRRGPRRS